MADYQKKYEEYLEKIQNLKGVSLEDTGLFSGNKDEILNCLHNNYIYSVGDLIDKSFAPIKGSMEIKSQVFGIINLLRNKYLGENLPCMFILNKKITCKELMGNIFSSLGFSQNFLFNAGIFYFDSKERVIDYLKRIMFSSSARDLFSSEDIKKVKIIVNWYDSQKDSYSFYKNISLEDTENIRLEDVEILMPGRNLDSVYARLKRNNINNLQEVFLKDAEHTIKYGSQGYNFVNFQTAGTVKLLRCKYLNEDLPFGDILDGEIQNDGGPICIKKLNELEPEEITAVEYLCKMGLSFKFACGIQEYMEHKDTVIVFLEKFMANKDNLEICCKKGEYDRNIKKLEIIIGWYNLKYNEEVDLSELNQTRNTLINYHIKLKRLKEERNRIDEQIIIVSEKIQNVKADELRLLRRKKNGKI